MIDFNIFSGKLYNTFGSVKTDQDGNVFNKSGSSWISTHGDVIQETSGGYLNVKTGTLSTFGDPFDEVNHD
jgi:hypothetical protein